jgi:hypothetical protein
MTRARPSDQAGRSSTRAAKASRPSGDHPSRLRTSPDPERLSCWCKGWGYFYNTANGGRELTFCGNCEDARKPDPLAGLSELEKDLYLARQGDYPGAAGCRRIVGEIDRLRAALDEIASKKPGCASAVAMRGIARWALAQSSVAETDAPLPGPLLDGRS